MPKLFHEKYREKNFENRRGTGRNGDVGVVTYVKSSIASRNEVFTKIIPRKKYCEKNFKYRRRKSSDRYEAVDTYSDLRESKTSLKYVPKLFHEKYREKNFENRRGTGRNGDVGVVTYVKSSIASRNEVFTKIIPRKKGEKQS